MHRTAVAVILVAIAAPVRAQPPEPASLRGESQQTRKRLTEADQKLLDGKTADAVDDLQRILDEAAGDWIAVDGKQFRTAQWYVQQILAKLPPEALRNYRDQIDAPARKLLEAAKRTRDPQPLWQLLDRYFVSRPADEGALLLGDLLFERGEFRSAELVWRRLLPGGGADLPYPGSRSDPASVSARLILASIFSRDLARAKNELAEFQKKYGQATGTLAGKTGRLATILTDLANDPPRLNLSHNDGKNWRTFGGADDHAGAVGERIPAEWDLQPQVVTLSGQETSYSRPPFGHPVVVNERLYLTDGFTLIGCDLKDPRLVKTFTLHKVRTTGERTPAPCPSLTAAEGRLYVRAGPSVYSAPPNGNGQVSDSTLVCLEPKPETADGFKQLWSLPPPVGDGRAPAVWEGAPQVAGRRLWAAYARFESGRIVHGIACYDPADAAEAPDHPAWAVDVCDSAVTAGNETRTRQELVTLAGRHVVFCSHTGAVVALDAVTGRRAWAYRYPRDIKANPGRSPDPAPAVAQGGRVFVAPADAHRVLALDAETGALLWDWVSEKAEGLRIVGVAAGRVVVASSGSEPGIYGLDIVTGSNARAAGGWTQYQNNAPAMRGLGFVSENVVLCPTYRGLFVFDPAGGIKSAPRLAVPEGGGNLIYADGRMILVTANQILIYRSELKEFPAATSSGDAARLRFLRLTTRAERELADRKPELARTTLAAVARSDLPAPYRAWAAARLLLLSPQVREEVQLPEDVRSLLTPELRAEWVIPPDGQPLTLGDLVERQLGRKPGELHAVSLAHRSGAAPKLAAEPELERTVRLAPGATPLQPIPGADCSRRLFFVTVSDLIAVTLARGVETRYHLVAPTCAAAETGAGFVAVGPTAVALYADGPAPAWTFRVPDTDPLPAVQGEFRLYSIERESPPELSAFRICGAILVARLGLYHLIAFDLQNKRVAWVLGSDRQRGYRSRGLPGSPRFAPAFYLGAQLAVAQLSDGRRWLIRTETGLVPEAPAFAERTARVPWPSPPVPLGGNLVIADGPGIVRLVNPLTREVKWTFSEPRRESSLCGEPPQVRVCGDALVIAVRRNYGVELHRLHPATGKPLWRDGPVFLDVERVPLDDLDSDSACLYIPAGNTLVAVKLASGETAWEAKLSAAPGAGGWIVRAGENGVFAYPHRAIPREDVAVVWNRLRRGWEREPLLWRLPPLGLGLCEAWVERMLPFLTFDPETGRHLATVEVPAAGPAAAVCFERDRVVIATGNHLCWAK